MKAQLLTGQRIAEKTGVCCEPGCMSLVWPGHVIVKRPGGGWRHVSCTAPPRLRRDGKGIRRGTPVTAK